MTIGMTWVAEDDQDDWGDHNIFIATTTKMSFYIMTGSTEVSRMTRMTGKTRMIRITKDDYRDDMGS